MHPASAHLDWLHSSFGIPVGMWQHALHDTCLLCLQKSPAYGDKCDKYFKPEKVCNQCGPYGPVSSGCRTHKHWSGLQCTSSHAHQHVLHKPVAYLLVAISWHIAPFTIWHRVGISARFMT
jgi:hypothetical protein